MSVENITKKPCSGSTWDRRFQEYLQLDIFVKLWTRLLKINDDERGVKWKWQSLFSISIKFLWEDKDMSK